MELTYVDDKFMVQLKRIYNLVDLAITAPKTHYSFISNDIKMELVLDKKHIRNMVMHDLYYADAIQEQLKQITAKLKAFPRRISKHVLLVDAFTDVIVFGGEIIQTCIAPLGILMFNAEKETAILESKYKCLHATTPNHICSSSCAI